MANVRIDGLTDLATRVKNMGKEARGAAGEALRKGAETSVRKPMSDRPAAPTVTLPHRAARQSIWPTS